MKGLLIAVFKTATKATVIEKIRKVVEGQGQWVESHGRGCDAWQIRQC